MATSKNEPQMLTLDSSWWNLIREIPGLGFGDSMLPSLTPGLELIIRKVSIAEVRVGDIVAVQRWGTFCAHRVVKVLSRQHGGVRLITKGDNRCWPETSFHRGPTVGKIVRAGERDLTSVSARTLGRLLAWISYFPSAGAAWLIKRWPRSNNFVTRWTNRLHPLLVWNRLQRKLAQRSRTTQWGGTIRSYRETDAIALVALWNRCRLHRTLTLEKFLAEIRKSPWFSPETCLVALEGHEIVGWIWLSDRKRRFSTAAHSKKGFLEALFVDPNRRRRGIGSRLLEEALQRFRLRYPAVHLNGYLPVYQQSSHLISLDASIAFLKTAGFDLSLVGYGTQIETGVVPEKWRTRVTGKLRDSGIAVRMAEPGDRQMLLSLFKRTQSLVDLSDDDITFPVNEFGFAVGLQKGKLIGFCRWNLPGALPGVHQQGWIWGTDGKEPVGNVGWLFLEPLQRLPLLRAALVAEALMALYLRGIRRAQWWGSALGRRAFPQWGSTSRFDLLLKISLGDSLRRIVTRPPPKDERTPWTKTTPRS